MDCLSSHYRLRESVACSASIHFYLFIFTNIKQATKIVCSQLTIYGIKLPGLLLKIKSASMYTCLNLKNKKQHTQYYIIKAHTF